MIGALIAAVIEGAGATCFEPPSFDFKEVPKAVRYGYYITDAAGKDFAGGKICYTEPYPTNSLAPVWGKLTNGTVKVQVWGLDGGNNKKGLAGEATFTKADPPPRTPVPAVPPEDPYEAYWPVRDRVLGENVSWIEGGVETFVGKPDSMSSDELGKLGVSARMRSQKAMTVWFGTAETVGKTRIDMRRARAFIGKSSQLRLGVCLCDGKSRQPMPEALVKMQLMMAKELFLEGTIDGLSFCGSDLCGTNAPAVKYAKFWVNASKSAKQNPPAAAAKKPRNPHLQPNPELPDGYVEARWIPIAEGEANLAPFGEEYAEDGFEVRRRSLVDGSHGTATKGPATIRFERPVELNEVRLSLPQASFDIEADGDGDGKFETLLASVRDGHQFSTWGDLPEIVWYVRRFAQPVTVRQVRLSCVSTELQLVGAKAEAEKFAAPKPLAAAPKLELTGPANTNWTDVAEDDRLYFGFTLEGWMLGSQSAFGNYYKKGTPVPPVTQWSSWGAFTNDWNYFNANFVLFFPPKTSVQPPGSKRRGPFSEALLWPSKVWYLSQPYDIMRQFNDEIHKYGWKNFVITRSWLFHEDQAKLDALGAKPQVVLADEIAATGADGIAAGFDEQTFGLPPAGEMAPELLKKMMKTSDLDRMPYKKDSVDSKYRKRFIEWYYANEQGGWMREVKEAQMKRNPKALTFCGYGGCDTTWHYVNSIGGSDYWGYDGNVDVVGGDGTYCDMSDQPYGSAGTFVNSAVQVAYSRKRLSMATLGYNWANVWYHQENRERNPAHYVDHPDVCMVAGALATYFAKGRYANYWRWNYGSPADLKSPTVRFALKDAGFMVRKLAEWGGWKAEVPKDVLVLRSRRSEHYWYSHALAGNDTRAPAGERDRYASWRLERTRDARLRAGDTYFFWTAYQLVKAAMPFEIYPIQRVAAWKDRVKDYKAIVIPSGYVIADDELAELKRFAALGRKIIVVGANAGEADGFGEKRAVNAFADVPNVTVIPFTPAFDENSPKLEKAFADALQSAVGCPSLTLARDKDHDVQAYRLNAKDDAALVMVANYSERPTSVNLGVTLPKGKYRLEVCSSGVTKPGFVREGIAGVRTGTVGGKEIFSAEEARTIRLDLRPEDCLMLRFVPVSFWKGLFK